MSYRGRLAPSPTGYMHLGHARTFSLAAERAQAAGGTLVLRIEDLDRERCRPVFVEGWLEDLRWYGLEWQEGPGVGGSSGPYVQSERLGLYRAAFDRLKEANCVYPCACSRKDILAAVSAPHPADEESIYPGTCRNRRDLSGSSSGLPWRFRVPDGEVVRFEDQLMGSQSFKAGEDFGDFVVWRRDGLPSYQLAVVVDDAAMEISEVVRGADLLLSTARQILLYRALGFGTPKFAHCPLVTDERGVRLAKRHEALSLRSLRERGWTAEDVRAMEPASLMAGRQGGVGRRFA